MSQRDELADLIEATGNDTSYWAEQVADAILAAGYSRPRVVETIEERDALPVGTVLRYPDGEIGMVMVTTAKERRVGYPGTLPTDSLDRIDLPATVLYMPEEAK